MGKTDLGKVFIELNRLVADSKKPKEKDDSPIDFYVYQSVSGSISEIKELLIKTKVL